MPSYQFKDSENKTFEIVPEGKHILEVKSVDFGIVSGGNCNGSDCMDIDFTVDNYPGATIYKKFIFHEKTAWVVDVFVKAFNLKINGRAPARDENIDFDDELLIGLRGPVILGIREYENNAKQKKKANEIVQFITNEEKLPKRVITAESDPAGEASPW